MYDPTEDSDSFEYVERCRWVEWEEEEKGMVMKEVCPSASFFITQSTWLL